jgi:hypothetical protein
MLQQPFEVVTFDDPSAYFASWTLWLFTLHTCVRFGSINTHMRAISWSVACSSLEFDIRGAKLQKIVWEQQHSPTIEFCAWKIRTATLKILCQRVGRNISVVEKIDCGIWTFSILEMHTSWRQKSWRCNAHRIYLSMKSWRRVFLICFFFRVPVPHC